MILPTLFLLNTLVLRSGQHLDLDGPWREENGRVLFRANGTLFSIPKSDVDLDTTRALAAPPLVATPPGTIKLKASEEERKRLIAELEQNHSGTPGPRGVVAGVTTVEESVPPNPDEWEWRNRARGYEERIRQARESRDLLLTRADQLRSHISSLFSLGYHPSQFTYDTSQLQYTLEAIPSAELEITRAERAYAQFREDARRMAIAPGWLR